MASLIGNTRTCSFNGTDITAAHVNRCVRVAGALAEASSGRDAQIPRVIQSNAAGESIYGVVKSVDVTNLRCSVQVAGIVNVEKDSTAPADTDIGGGLVAAAAGRATPTANEGRGTIVNITGTATTDFLVVDLGIDAGSRS